MRAGSYSKQGSLHISNVTLAITLHSRNRTAQETLQISKLSDPVHPELRGDGCNDAGHILPLMQELVVNQAVGFLLIEL